MKTGVFSATGTGPALWRLRILSSAAGCSRPIAGFASAMTLEMTLDAAGSSDDSEDGLTGSSSRSDPSQQLPNGIECAGEHFGIRQGNPQIRLARVRIALNEPQTVGSGPW